MILSMCLAEPVKPTDKPPQCQPPICPIYFSTLGCLTLQCPTTHYLVFLFYALLSSGFGENAEHKTCDLHLGIFFAHHL